MNNMSQIMKQAKAMQDKMAELQKKIEDTEIEGASGGGAVKIVMNGKHEVKKIDIETSEYRILDELIENQEKFTGIAIEFHDVDLHLDKILKFITSLNMTLVHIHPMNQALTVNGTPIQIELSFAKNPKKIGENTKIPHPLDMPGDPSFEDIPLKFE